MKIHKYKFTGDFREQGQTDFELKHSTECGYVRKEITRDEDEVTCNLCLQEIYRKRDTT